jgi:hypothetical protein
VLKDVEYAAFCHLAALLSSAHYGQAARPPQMRGSYYIRMDSIRTSLTAINDLLAWLPKPMVAVIILILATAFAFRCTGSRVS